MKAITTIIKVFFVAYLVIFAVHNTQTVDLRLFFDMATISMPLFLFAICLMIVGVFIGIMMTISDKFSKSREIKKLKQEINDANNEIIRIKNITLTQNSTTVQSSLEEEKSNQNIDELESKTTNNIKDNLR